MMFLVNFQILIEFSSFIQLCLKDEGLIPFGFVSELGGDVFMITMVLGRTPVHANDVACAPDEVELVRYGQQKLISLENGSPYVCMSYSKY